MSTRPIAVRHYLQPCAGSGNATMFSELARRERTLRTRRLLVQRASSERAKRQGFAARNAFAKPSGVVLLSSVTVTPSRLGRARMITDALCHRARYSL